MGACFISSGCSQYLWELHWWAWRRATTHVLTVWWVMYYWFFAHNNLLNLHKKVCLHVKNRFWGCFDNDWKRSTHTLLTESLIKPNPIKTLFPLNFICMSCCWHEHMSVNLLYLWWRNMESKAFNASIMSSSCSPNSRLTQQHGWATSISSTLFFFRKPHRLCRYPYTSVALSTPAVRQQREHQHSNATHMWEDCPLLWNCCNTGCAEFLFLLHNDLTCLIRHIATQLLKQKANYQEYTQQRPKTTENDIPPVPFFTRNKVKLYFLKGRLVSKQLLICSSSNHRATISLIWSQGSGHLMMKQSQSNIPFFQLRFLALWLLGAHLCWRSSNCVCLLLDAEQVMYSRAFSQQHLPAAPENIATRVC